jgi:hypothetical protein
MRRRQETARVLFPTPLVNVAERRVEGLIRACCHEENIIRSLALSCYLQGLVDGDQVARRPQELQHE